MMNNELVYRTSGVSSCSSVLPLVAFKGDSLVFLGGVTTTFFSEEIFQLSCLLKLVVLVKQQLLFHLRFLQEELLATFRGSHGRRFQDFSLCFCFPLLLLVLRDLIL